MRAITEDFTTQNLIMRLGTAFGLEQAARCSIDRIVDLKVLCESQLDHFGA